MLPRIDDLIRRGETEGIEVTPLKNVRVFAEQATSKRELLHVADVIETFAATLPDDEEPTTCAHDIGLCFECPHCKKSQ